MPSDSYSQNSPSVYIAHTHTHTHTHKHTHPQNSPSVYIAHTHTYTPIRKRIQFKSLTLTYKCLNNQAPTYLSDLLVPRQSSYNTQSSQHLLLHVPIEHTNLSVIVHFPYVPPSYGIIYHTISSNVNP